MKTGKGIFIQIKQQMDSESVRNGVGHFGVLSYFYR